MPTIQRYPSAFGRKKPGPWSRPLLNPFTSGGDGLWLLGEGTQLTRGGYYLPNQSATATGTVTPLGGPFGGPCYSFDGSTGYFGFGQGFLNFAVTSQFSGVAWIRTTSASAQTIVAKWQNTQPGWAFRISSSHLPIFGLLGGGTGYQAQCGPPVNDGKWHQVGFAYDGSQAWTGISLYVDGVQQSTTQLLNSSPGSLADVPFLIGANQNGASNTATQFFNGQIDHVFIHAGLWLPKDFARLYQQPFAMFAPTPPARSFFTPPPPGFAFPGAQEEAGRQSVPPQAPPGSRRRPAIPHRASSGSWQTAAGQAKAEGRPPHAPLRPRASRRLPDALSLGGDAGNVPVH